MSVARPASRASCTAVTAPPPAATSHRSVTCTISPPAGSVGTRRNSAHSTWPTTARRSEPSRSRTLGSTSMPDNMARHPMWVPGGKRRPRCEAYDAVVSCLACGSDLPDGARFCPACGAEQAAPQEERKLVSILFVDMVGSTVRADGADPEDVRDRNQLYFSEARQRIEHYGGIVEKYIGDAVMAVFGTPLAKADDAERAVQAALSIIDGIHELNVTHPGLDLEVRGAVCTGEAVVAIDAAPSEPIATGDVANTAARLQNAAPPGGVLIGQQTYELVRHSFDLTPLEPIQAKGKRDPVAAWHVLAPLGAPGARPMSGTPFVGRDDELEILSRVWDRAVDASRPHLVTILGPAGIGKTRLGRELSYHVERTGGIALWGRSLPYEERSPYRAAGQIIGQVADVYESDGVATARAKLATAISTLFPEPDADEATRYLSVVLGLGLDEPPDEAVP